MWNKAILAGIALGFSSIVAVFTYILDASAAQASDDHGDYRTEATSVQTDGLRVTGEIDPTTVLSDVDYFSFQTKRGVQYTFVLTLDSVGDANLLVVNSVDRGARSSPGQILTSHDNQRTVQWIARTTDTYFFEVSGTRANDGLQLLGSYSVSVNGDSSLEDRHSDDEDTASPIVVDNVYQGAISPWTNQPGLTGTNDGGDDYDYFLFTASRGVKYVVDVELGTAEGAEISISSLTGGTEVNNNGVGTSLEWISSTTDSYYVVVSGSSRFRASVGTYSLRLSADTSYLDRHSQSHIAATSLSFDNAHQGSVSPADDRDVFSFQATRGVRYTIQAELLTAQGIGLSLEAQGGDTVASNAGVGNTLAWTAPANNLYFLVASGSSQVRDPVGTYSLVVSEDTSLEDRHGDTTDNATFINLGNEHLGAVSPPSDQDYFFFPAQKGVAYSIEATLYTAQGLGITVIGPNGNTEVSNGGLGTKVNWTATTSNNYFVVVAAPPLAGDPAGTYALRIESNEALEDRHGDTWASATQVTWGSTYAASVSPEGDSDFFQFKANRGVRYTFELSYGTAPGVSLALDKINGGNSAASNFGEGTDVQWIAPDDDDYFVTITGSPRVEDPVGTYFLKILRDTVLEDRHSDSATEASLIVIRNAMAGAISPADDVDYFSFDANQGDSYVVLVELGTVDAVRLSVTQDVAGFTASNYGNGTSLRWEAPVAGAYIVAVSGLESATDRVGTYQITVAASDSITTAVAVSTPTPAPTPIPTVSPTPLSNPEPVVSPDGPALIAGFRTAPSNSLVLLPVMIQKTEGLTSLGFTIEYDASIAELVGVSKGASLLSSSFTYNGDSPGAVRLGFAASTEVNSGWSAAIAEFKVIGEEGSVSTVAISDILATGVDGHTIALEAVNGRINVGQSIPGDGNGDGRVTALDALIALRMFVDISPEDPVLDLDGDGRVTPQDARQILAMSMVE